MQADELSKVVSVDSAQMYNNEKQTGSAINAFLASPANSSKLTREDIFYTSKLSSNTTYESARKSISKSAKVCGLGYIDLFLLHSPYGGKEVRLESWQAVEDAIDAGEVKSGGVSNYGVKHVCSPKSDDQEISLEVAAPGASGHKSTHQTGSQSSRGPPFQHST